MNAVLGRRHMTESALKSLVKSFFYLDFFCYLMLSVRNDQDSRGRRKKRRSPDQKQTVNIGELSADSNEM